MAATVFICAAVSISQASAYPSIVAVASPPTDVSASRHYTHHRRYKILHHTLAANITIFPAMNGIPVVGTGGTIPKMNGIGRLDDGA